MIPLSDIIKNMTKEEQVKFASFLKKNKNHPNSQKLKLFRLILEEKVNPKMLATKLYGADKKAAYHQLRKRLFAEIIDFISAERFNKEEEHILEIKKLILTGKHLIENKNYKSGFSLLKKGEDKAEEENEVELLNEIFNLYIQFAHYNPDKNLQNSIEKLESNRAQMIQESNLTMAYATVKEKLEEFHKQGIDIDFDQLLNEIFDRFKISEKSGSNYKTLYQLVQIIAANANVTKEYHQVAPFVTSWYKTIEQKEEENSRNVFFHIKLLYFIANVFFRDKNFGESNHYIAKMEALIAENQKYQKIFETKILVLKSLNHNYLGENKKAQEIIELVVLAKPDLRNKDVLDAMVVASMVYFHQKEYKKVQNMYGKLHAAESWYTKTMGTLWVMNKNLIEILTHIELENIDYVESRLDSFMKKNKEFLQQDPRISIYLKYLRLSFSHPDKVQTEEFQTTFFDAVENKPRQREDIYVLSFLAYLKAKMLGEETYETTLDLVKKVV
ncbi:MAG: hypothetical protein ABF242_01795 [Flavobacteriales bacterium]